MPRLLQAELRTFSPGSLCTVALAWGFSLPAATLPSDWQHQQSFSVTDAGLVKLSLPVETLDAARAGLEDPRLYDEAGNEVPYLIERPAPTAKLVQGVKSFQVSMQPRSTAITIETGLNQPLDTVTLETPAMNFLKPVRVEGSVDGSHWQPIAQGQPIFRQPNGASRLQVSFISGVWPWLRLTVDDQRFAPIPFTAARVHATVIEPAPSEWMPVSISERHENPGVTRLELNLGAANLSIASLQLETAEPLFTRQVTLAAPQISEDSIREQTVGQGTIYRVAVEGQPGADHLSVPLETLVRSRELLLFIKNQDNPPLPITAVRAERRPVYLVFLARQAGTFHLLTGNSRCAAPRYDLAALGMNLKSVPVATIKLPPPAANANYQPPEILAGIEDNSTSLDVTEWKYRKPVKLIRAGAQQLQLDLEVLAHAQPGFGDLRLLRDGRQVPYILELTSISRALTPAVTATNDAKDAALSRWILKLPQSNLPVTRLTCVARTALFEREMTLYEELANERGEKFRRDLAGGLWVQTPNRASKDFALELNGPLQSGTLFLETHNRDNPPVVLENFQLFHPVSRVLFKAKAGDELFLYFGNRRAAPPRYDLGLVADQLLTADKTIATLAGSEQLKQSSWRENQMPGKGGVVFWGILAVVVVVLLVIISRLLPKAPPPQ